MNPKPKEPNKSEYLQTIQQLPEIVRECSNEMNEHKHEEFNGVENPDSLLITLHEKFNEKSAEFMVDSGATCNIVPKEMIEDWNCLPTPINRVDLRMANGQSISATQQVKGAIL